MAKRLRNIRIQLRVNEQEKALIDQKMKELGTKNTEAYLRKMAIDGLIIHLDTADVRELVRVLRVTSNSLNQLTKRVHETGSIYSDDIEDLGHTLKGIGMSLGISTNLEAVTAQYVDVRLERKKTVLETYHKALQPKKAEQPKEAAGKKTPTKGKKKSSEMEL